MTRFETKRVNRRLEILQSAKAVFAERGYHVASISDIIKRAGIARGTFYLYFSSKDAVFESILDQAIEDLQERIIGIDMDPGSPPPAKQLHQNVTRVLEYMLGDRALIRLILNHGLPPESDLTQRVDAFFGHVEALIEVSLSYGMSMGLVRQCDASLTAAQILGAARGALRKLTRVQEDFDTTPVATQMIDFALRGVVVPAKW